MNLIKIKINSTESYDFPESAEYYIDILQRFWKQETLIFQRELHTKDIHLEFIS